MKQKFVGLLVGGLTVVSGNRDVDVIRDQPRLQPFEPVRDILRHDHRVGARPLGQRQADRRDTLPAVLAVARVIPGAVLGGVRPMTTDATSLT